MVQPPAATASECNLFGWRSGVHDEFCSLDADDSGIRMNLVAVVARPTGAHHGTDLPPVEADPADALSAAGVIDVFVDLHAALGAESENRFVLEKDLHLGSLVGNEDISKVDCAVEAGTHCRGIGAPGQDQSLALYRDNMSDGGGKNRSCA